MSLSTARESLQWNLSDKAKQGERAQRAAHHAVISRKSRMGEKTKSLASIILALVIKKKRFKTPAKQVI